MNRTMIIICTLVFQFYDLKSQDKYSGNIVDAHVHNGFKIDDGIVIFDNLGYFIERGISSFFYAMPVDRSKTIDLTGRITQEVNQIDNLVIKCQTIYYGIEYFYGVFNKDLANIDLYHQTGIKYITLIDNSYDELFNEIGELSEWGKQVVDKMNTVGILIDISHLNDHQAYNVIKYSNAPIIASHSCAYDVANINGNLSKKVIEALKENNGFVMISFNTINLFKDEILYDDGIVRFVNHIDYLKNQIGIKNIGIGSDYQAHGQYIPESLNKKDVFNTIYNELISRNYTESDVSNIFETNILELFTD